MRFMALVSVQPSGPRPLRVRRWRWGRCRRAAAWTGFWHLPHSMATSTKLAQSSGLGFDPAHGARRPRRSTGGVGGAEEVRKVAWARLNETLA